MITTLINIGLLHRVKEIVMKSIILLLRVNLFGWENMLWKFDFLWISASPTFFISCWYRVYNTKVVVKILLRFLKWLGSLNIIHSTLSNQALQAVTINWKIARRWQIKSGIACVNYLNSSITLYYFILARREYKCFVARKWVSL